jgi:hypothetical protein
MLLDRFAGGFKIHDPERHLNRASEFCLLQRGG